MTKNNKKIWPVGRKKTIFRRATLLLHSTNRRKNNNSPLSLGIIRRKNYFLLGATVLLVVGMLVSSFLPSLSAQALSTKTWTSNADFAKNKVSQCRTTTLKSLEVSGVAYGDNTCAAAETDALLTLATQGADNTSTLAVGVTHSLALAVDGTVWAWGRGNSGQLGDGTNINVKNFPEQVKSANGSGLLTDITSVASGANYSLALKSDGTVWAWGANNYGQLGDGTSTDRPLPVQVKTGTGGYLTDVTMISAGSYHSMATLTDSTIWAWGYNTSGQLGDGTTINKTLPVQVKDAAGTGFLTAVSSVSTGQSHSLAVKSDGTMWAWGSNTFRQLGDGTSAARSLPVQVKDAAGTGFLTAVSSVSTGQSHSLAVKSDGTMWAWGSNSNGQLGDGTTINKTLPVQVKDAAGTGFLTNVSVLSTGSTYSIVIKKDATLWAWGTNSNGQLGDGTNIDKSLPVQVKDAAGTGFLTNTKTISAGATTAMAVISSGTMWAWGNNSTRQLADNTTANRNLPVQPRDTSGIGFLTDIRINSDYKPTGSISGFIVDTGAGKKTRWSGIDWQTSALPASTSVAFGARTSDDGITWSNWNEGTTQAGTSTTDGTHDISGMALSRYLEIKTTLATADKSVSPTVTEFSLTSVTDVTPPDTNASNIEMSKTTGGTSIADGDWLNTPNPYFSWDAGSDTTGGTGIQGYCLYLGTDSSADVTTTKGILGASPVDTGGSCPYAVYDTHLDLSTIESLATPLTTSPTESYHLLIKPIDYASLIFQGPAASYTLRYDDQIPKNPAFISAPSQFVSTKDVTLTWQTSGNDAASDDGSGVAGLQYRIGSSNRWFGDSHAPQESLTDLLANDGNYQTNTTHDYPLLTEGNNVVSFRTVDKAGNVSAAHVTTVIKINTSSPTTPLNVTASPATNTQNAFAFSWKPPASFVGPANALSYCYTINTLPTASNCQYTAPGVTSLAADAFATQPGANIFYVVARDEAGNINYDTHAAATFTANTPAPGIPRNYEVADVSTKASSIWKIALSWSAPESIGAGIAKYTIYRSTDALTYAQIATTGGSSYVDGSLNQITYHYKIRACDSANNCGAFSEPLTMLPSGRYTSPPGLVGSVTTKISTRSAEFNWTTDRTGDSRIQYGTASGRYLSGEVTVSAPTRSHKVELLNLDAGTTYYYTVKWTDEDGNTGISSELSFTTLPAPVIKSVQVIKKTLNSALVQFTSTDAAKVDILYGKTDNFGGLKTVNTSRSESTYTVELTGLDDGSQYSFKIVTYDGDDNRYDSRRLDNFSTPARPKISNLRFQPVDGEPTSTQRVTWSTNVPASSTATYGKTDTAGTDTYTSKLTTEHSVVLKSLQDNSQYFLFVQSRDVDGNLATSDRQYFKTSLDTRPPQIQNIKIETSVKGYGSDARGQIIVSWSTDEPSTSQVAYGEGSSGDNYSSRTAQDAYLTTEHVVVISDLGISKVYHLQPISSDRSDNSTDGADQSAIIGRASESVLSIILNSLNRVFGL